ncbi:MBL fold metallo-hydrolase [Pseudoalteromonas lipolytica]|uniref:MBL fold metallo-hydrolase n=1 Tax=Pseudoalteromonas lipolytica TaxID=570156 RepID=A0ABU8SPK1_9GAMM
MRFCAFLICLFVSYSAKASVSWHSITPEIQFLQQQNKLRFYDSNQVLIEGKECALMFDASGNFAEVEKLAEQLKKRLKTPLCYLVASHYHDDHLLGLAVLQAEFPEAKLIVHQQVATEFVAMQQALTDKLDGYEKSIELSYQRLANQPKNQQAVWRDKLELAKKRLFRWRELTLNPPAINITESTQLDLGNYPIVITPYQAHTKGDLTLSADQGRVLLGGDIVDSLPYPGHGSFSSWISALQYIQKNTTLTTILPGHGKPLTPAELALPLRFLKTIQEMTNSSPDKPVSELIPLFPTEIKQQYQLDEVGERAFSMFLEAGLKQGKLSK